MYRTALSWHSTKSLDIYITFNCRAVCLLKVGFVYNTSLLQNFFIKEKKWCYLMANVLCWRYRQGLERERNAAGPFYAAQVPLSLHSSFILLKEYEGAAE